MKTDYFSLNECRKDSESFTLIVMNVYDLCGHKPTSCELNHLQNYTGQTRPIRKVDRDTKEISRK